MSKLEPFNDDCDDFERSLLRSVRGDTPPTGAASRTIAALGLDPAKVAAIAATQAATTTVLGVRSLSIAAVLKGLGIGALIGVAVMSVAGQRTRPQNPTAAPSTARVGHRSPAEAPHAAPASALSAEPAFAPSSSSQQALRPGADAQPAAAGHPESTSATAKASIASPTEAPVRAPAVAAFAAAPSANTTSREESVTSIAEQVQVIDRARSTLKAGRASEAITLVNAYTQRWPQGALSIEAIILRIEAELALHDRSAAERDARGVIASRPGTRYETRVRALFSPPLDE